MNIKNQLLIAKEYNISIEELFFIELLFLAQPNENKPELLYEYFQLKQRNSPRNMLIRFQEIGIINKSYKIPDIGSSFQPENVEFNKNFLHKYFQYSEILGMELWDKFPPYLTVKGINYTAKNISKKFNSIEEFFFAYGRAIKFNPETHKQVLNILDWAIEHELITNGICEYIISKQWETHKQLKDQGFDGQSLDIIDLI